MPAFNVAPYIGEAIDSVIAQTFTDFELFVIDDGSTDDTRSIAERYARTDRRIRVLCKPNGGISSARNFGLQAATGGLIALLDSDDIWLPGYLQAQSGILDAHPEVDVLTANAWFLGSQLDGRPARPWPDSRAAPDLAHMLADEEAIFVMCIFRRKVYEAIGGFDESMRTNEDYDYWLRAAVAGFTFYRNDEPLGRYRRRDDSLSASEVRMVRGILRVFEKLRPALLNRPGELAILDSQVSRFETARLRAEIRHALANGDGVGARPHLAALYHRRGGAVLGLARLMARWTPRLLTKAYQMRRFRQVTS